MMGGTCGIRIWQTGLVHTGFGGGVGDVIKRNSLEDLGVDGRIILK
jgi:hypothetical protein